MLLRKLYIIVYTYTQIEFFVSYQIVSLYFNLRKLRCFFFKGQTVA